MTWKCWRISVKTKQTWWTKKIFPIKQKHWRDQAVTALSKNDIYWVLKEKSIQSLFSCFDCCPQILTKGTFCFFLACPFIYAMCVVGMIAWSPRNSASIAFYNFISLAFETCFINAILTDGTVLNRNIPTPQGNSIPLFNFDSLVNLHIQIIIIWLINIQLSIFKV